VGSPRECTRILGLDGFRVERLEWETDGARTRVRIWIDRRGIRGYECSGCRRRTWRVRDSKPRTWDDLPWAEHRVILVYAQRRVWCRTCGIRTERVAFAEGHARITRRLRQVIGLDCQSMPTSHAAVRHGVSWSKARRAEHAFLAEWDRTRPKRRPRHLGADEIHRGKGQKFYTVLSDLVHGEVIGLAPDRTEASLAGLLTTRLDARQRAAVEAVCTDMHRPYGGIHFRFDQDEGADQGRRLGEYSDRFWIPQDKPDTLALGMPGHLGTGGGEATRRSITRLRSDPSRARAARTRRRNDLHVRHRRHRGRAGTGASSGRWQGCVVRGRTRGRDGDQPRADAPRRR
jgi:hypothetical protein